MNQEMNKQISNDRKIIIKPVIITPMQCSHSRREGQWKNDKLRGQVRTFENLNTKTKHCLIEKLSSDLGFLHNSHDIFIFKRPKTKVLRHSKNATVLEIWLDQGIYTGEKIFSFYFSVGICFFHTRN